MKKEEPTTLPALIAKGQAFAVATAKIVIDPAMAAEITEEDFVGYEDDGQAFPIVTIRQQDDKDERGRLMSSAGGFKMYDPVAATNEIAIPDVPAETGLLLTVLADQSSRVYFPNMGDPVACRSNDGLTGQGKPGGTCAACNLNKLSPYYEGASTTCKAQKNLLAYDHVGKRAFVLRLNPSALTIWKNFKAIFKQQSLPLSAVVIQVHTKYVADDKGKYYIPVFNIAGVLPIETFKELREIKNAAKPSLDKTVEIVVDDETANRAVPTSDPGGDLPPGVDPVSNKIAGIAQRAKDDEGLPF
jgi:hypothetical protein